MAGKFKIYTKNGDLGDTSLCDGSKTSKDSQRVEAYGCVDELNSFIGISIVRCSQIDIKDHLMEIQKDLHMIGANLAFPGDLSQSLIKGESLADKIPRINEETLLKLENWIDTYDIELPVLKHFILCGGDECSASLHQARTVCRRAEREIVRLKKTDEVNRILLKYMNRLSDYLFMAARLASHRVGKEDIMWLP